MARVTVEDCILNIPNRFELVLMAAQRAKQISSGNPLTIERDNDKDAVVSLREIAEQTVSLAGLLEETINAFCKRQAVDIADSKAAGQDDLHMDVAQAFEEASKHLGKQEEEAEDAGLSFEGEDVTEEQEVKE